MTSHIKESIKIPDTRGMANEKSQKEKSMLMALVLFLAAGALIFAYLSGENKKKQPGAAAVTKTKKFEQSVNRHLMLTNERMELEKQRMALENAKILNNPISATRPQKAYSNDDRLDLSGDMRAADVAKELGRGPRQEEIISPHDVVQKEIFNEELARQQSQAYREEYARQFIENARRGGYNVKLSEDLSRVISVTPIRNPSADFQVFDGNGSIRGSQ